MLNNPNPSLAVTAPASPLYQRRQTATSTAPTDAPADGSGMRLAGMASPNRIDENAYSKTPSSTSASSAGDPFRRALASSEQLSTTIRAPPLPPSAKGLYTPPQSPLPTSSPNIPTVMSPFIHDIPTATYFPLPAPHQRSSSVSSQSSTRPKASPPYISSTASSNLPPILQLRQSQSQLNVKMEIESSGSHHTLLAPLGDKFTADGITISAKRNNVLLIMADRWDQEKDCHVEWEVTLDRDADMSNVHAQFMNGLLKVTVKRW